MGTESSTTGQSGRSVVLFCEELLEVKEVCYCIARLLSAADTVVSLLDDKAEQENLIWLNAACDSLHSISEICLEKLDEVKKFLEEEKPEGGRS